MRKEQDSWQAAKDAHTAPWQYFCRAAGRGLLAGLAGTAAMTVAQLIEMQLTGREPSDTPYKAFSKVFGLKARNEEEKKKLSNLIHWGYGTSWGIPRGLLAAYGADGAAGTGAHFAAVWGSELVMLPSLGVAEPVTKWGGKAIAQDVLFHLIYAVTTGLVADALTGYAAEKKK
ncbi:hypothetical protein [Pontibacter liquoris]|uniref:hypothetical protein n=1 Tax=Pontibacter liquoris TaxID=2905677 RepID=UPI001FA6F552|nr:hypothetical protein [Pontibacter liquoris]